MTTQVDIFMWSHLIFLRMHNAHFIWQLWVTKSDCRFYSNYFLKKIWNLNTLLILIDPLDLIIRSSIPLQLAPESISHVKHIDVILASSLWTVSLQALDTKQALFSASENAAGLENCANCCLLIHFAFLSLPFSPLF